MATRLSIFFGGRRDFNVGGISFDLLLEESHNFESEVTEHEIEDGSSTTDHIRNMLRQGSIKGLVTNFSIFRFGLFSDRMQDAYEELRRLWTERQPVSVVSNMEVYPSVAIESISINRSSDDGESMTIDLDFKEVKIVRLKTTTIEAGVQPNDMNSDINRQTALTSNSGRVTGTSGALP